MGLDLSELGQNLFAEAEQDFTQALQIVEQFYQTFSQKGQKPLHSPLAWVYYNRAMVRFEQGNYEAALTDINQAIKLDREDSDAVRLRVQIACRLKHWSQVEQDLATLTRLGKQDNTSFYLTQAEIALGLGEYQRAIQLLSNIIQLSKIVKDNIFTPIVEPKVYLLRGQAYEQLGQTHPALSDYCHYLLWRPDAPEAPSLIERMG